MRFAEIIILSIFLMFSWWNMAAVFTDSYAQIIAKDESGHSLYRNTFEKLRKLQKFQITEKHTSDEEGENTSKCFTSTTNIQYEAPNRLFVTNFDCNPVGKREIQKTIQVGSVACHSTSWVAKGKWFLAKSNLSTQRVQPENVVSTVLSLLLLPPVGIGEISSRANTYAHIKESFGVVKTKLHTIKN